MSNMRRFRLSLFLFSALVVSGCAEQPLPVESHYNRGVELYDKGKYTDAIKAYKLAILKDPDNLFAKYNLAVVYQDQGKLRQAMELYNEILEKTEDTNSRINLAAVHYALGNPKQAYQELKIAAENDRDSPDPLSALGEYLERKKKYKEAETIYKQALSLDKNHAVSHYRLARVYCKQGRTSTCIAGLKQAVELEPGVPRYMEELATQYANTNQTFEAINVLERVNLLQPGREDILVRLGNLYKQEKLYQEAIQNYWSALSIRDDNPEVHRNLIEVFEHMTEISNQKIEDAEASRETEESEEDSEDAPDSLAHNS